MSLLKLPQSFRANRVEGVYQAKLGAAAAAVGRRRGKPYEEVKEWTEQCQARQANILKELNRTAIAHKKATLLGQADPVHHQRLVSVMSGKANLWTTGPGYAKRMPKSVFRAGLHVALGIPVQPKPKVCKCGSMVDTLGNHFACCRLLPKRTQCHNYWRDTMACIVRMAGKSVKVEVAPEGERVRPGDIWIPGFKDGKPLAVDFAISAAVDPSAPDRIAHTKVQKYKAMCDKKGWLFRPVVGDGYGAVRGEGAAFITNVIKDLTEKVGKSWPAPSTLVWRTVSSCLMRRRAEAIAEAWAHGLVSSEMEEWEDPENDVEEGHKGDVAMEGGEECSSNMGGAGISNAQLLPQGDDILVDYEDAEEPLTVVAGQAPVVEEGFEAEL